MATTLNAASTLIIIIILVVVFNNYASAQIGLDWNRLRGENTEGAANSTANEETIREVLTNILRQFQDFAPDSGLPFPLPPGVFPGDDGDGENVTIIPVTELVTEGEQPQFPPGFENLKYVSPICLNHTMTLISDYLAGKRYAKQMVASAGSPPDASVEFSGYLADLGLFHQCRQIRAEDEDTPFDAEYCIMSSYIDIGAFHSGLCVPASCPDYDLKTILRTFIAALTIPAHIEVICEAPLPFNGADIFVIFLGVVLGLLMLIGTQYHLIKIHAKKKQKNKCYEKPPETGAEEEEEDTNNKNVELEPEDKDDAEPEGERPEREDLNIQDATTKESKSSDGTLDKVLMSFSIIHNFGKIFNTSQQKGTLSALNGLRVLSMFWIIISHTWQFLGTYRVDNPNYMWFILLPKFWAQTILNGVYAVDTFFLLSGLLLTYLTMKALKKGDGKIKWGLFIFHRFYRITPLYMLVLGAWATLPGHIVDGPAAKWFFASARLQCKDSWWTNLFYLNNLWPFPGDLGSMCMGWSWYLCNDMQFFLISPIILILLYKKRKVGFAVIGGLLLVSFFSTIGVTYYYGLTVGVNQKPFNNRTQDYPTADHVYAKPYHRIPTYLVGMIVGYALFKLEGKKFKIPWLVSVASWLVAAGSALGLVYGLHNTTEGHIVSQGATIFHYVVNCTVWGAAVGWVAFACIKGYGGPVNTILSWPVWTPLARLTFAAYLVHPMVQFMYIFSLPSALPPTVPVMTYHAIGFIFVSYGTGLIFSLAIEAPLMGLEKIWFKRH